MPQRDKTGPQGKGSKTGRGMGQCDSKKDHKESADVKNPQRGQGCTQQVQDFGQGQGRRRGNSNQ